MSRNPIINALGASGYILLVVSVMNYITKTLSDKPDTFFAPVLALSLLTLSVVVMGFMFFYTPIQLFIEGKKKEATKLFTKTVLIFATITAVVLALLLFRII